MMLGANQAATIKTDANLVHTRGENDRCSPAKSEVQRYLAHSTRNIVKAKSNSGTRRCESPISRKLKKCSPRTTSAKASALPHTKSQYATSRRPRAKRRLSAPNASAIAKATQRDHT